MRNKAFKVIEGVLIVALIFCAFLTIHTAFNAATGFNEENDLFKVKFTGTYQTSDMDKPEKLTDNTKIDADEVESVIFRGHFDEDIDKDVSIMMRYYYLQGELYINGVRSDTVGTPETYPRYMNSVGNGWVVVKSKGIKASDDLRIVLTRSYDNARSYAYTKFINNIYKGNSVALLQKMIAEEGYVLGVGTIFVVSGLVFLIALTLMSLLKINSQKYIIALAVLMLSSGIWMSLDYNIISFLIPKVYFLNLLEFICQNLMLISAVFYIKHFLNEKIEIIGKVSLAVQTIFFLYFLIVQSLGIKDGYQLNNQFAVVALTVIVVILGAVFYQWKTAPSKEIRFMGTSIFVLVMGTLIDIINYITDYSSIFIGMQLGLGIFVIMHGIKSILKMKENYETAENYNRLEKEIMENSMNVMVSQIQPHFMFNCLTAIQQLCLLNPDIAEDAISDFASFLRVNIDTLRSTRLVPFQNELIHIKHYISLEKMRFGDRVNVVYNIEKSDFMVPSLAVQPLVENAVRYGITKQAEGGTIVITTKKEKHDVIITVSDDGVGFDPNIPNDDGKEHLGIATVKDRLQSQCNGSLSVESKRGKGTLVTMVIPNIK